MINVSLTKRARLLIKYPRTSSDRLFDLIKATFLKQKTTPFPRLITIFMTYRCNLNCPMCLYAGYRQKHKFSDEIDINFAKKILPELKKFKPGVYFSGGEPLLNRDIYKIISLFSKNGILTALTTNGFLLEKSAQNIVNSGLEFLSFSLDHFNEDQHDQSRNVKTSYSKLMRGIKRLKILKKTTPSEIKINTVIGKGNYSELSKMYDFVETLGVDEWSLLHQSFITPQARRAMSEYHKGNTTYDLIVGQPINKNSYFSNKQTKILKKQLDEIMEKSHSYKTKFTIYPKIDNLYAYYQGRFPTKKSSCVMPFNSIYISDKSTITLCLGNTIGKLSSHKTIRNIWQSKDATTFRELISKEKILPLCFRCCKINYIFNI